MFNQTPLGLTQGIDEFKCMNVHAVLLKNFHLPLNAESNCDKFRILIKLQVPGQTLKLS